MSIATEGAAAALPSGGGRNDVAAATSNGNLYGNRSSVSFSSSRLGGPVKTRQDQTEDISGSSRHVTDSSSSLADVASGPLTRKVDSPCSGGGDSSAWRTSAVVQVRSSPAPFQSGKRQATDTSTGAPDILLAVVRDLDLGLVGLESPPDWTPPPVPKPRRLPVPKKRHSLVNNSPQESTDASSESSPDSSTVDTTLWKTWPTTTTNNKSAVSSTSRIVDIPPTAKDHGSFLDTYFSVEEPVDVDGLLVNESVLKTSQVIDVDDSDQDSSGQQSLPYLAEFETLKKLSEASINALKGKSS